MQPYGGGELSDTENARSYRSSQGTYLLFFADSEYSVYLEKLGSEGELVVRFDNVTDTAAVLI